ARAGSAGAVWVRPLSACRRAAPRSPRPADTWRVYERRRVLQRAVGSLPAGGYMEVVLQTGRGQALRQTADKGAGLLQRTRHPAVEQKGVLLANEQGREEHRPHPEVEGRPQLLTKVVDAHLGVRESGLKRGRDVVDPGADREPAVDADHGRGG